MTTSETVDQQPLVATNTAPVLRFVWTNTPTPTSATTALWRLAGRIVAIVGDDGPARNRVAEELRRYRASTWRLGDPGVPDAIVDLTCAEPFDPTRHRAVDVALARSLAVLRHCYQEWSQEADAHRLAYLAVTYLGGHSGYGAQAIHQPLGGIWAGLAKTLHRELPTVNAKVVDVAGPDLRELPEIVAAELYADGPAEIGYLDGVRHLLVPRPRAVSEPSVSLDASDVVLVCGGGMGIGFHLASTLARDHGCRVVATGRAVPAEDSEEWLHLDDTDFDAYRRLLLREAAGVGQVRQARMRIGKLHQLRELHANLGSAKDEGLPLRYTSCDTNDPVALAALVDELGPALSGVVFIAGVDRPMRLPGKSDKDFLAGVSVKVDGFLRLFGAVRHRELKFFCNSGSLTGRLGGMVGELDYAAANEGLARLGLWARQASGRNVLTVCWPLWRGLSVSSNVDAATRYMPAMEPGDGLAHWRAELLAPQVGEAVFLGPIGSGIDLAKGGQFVLERRLPGFDAVYPKIFHRGDPEIWQPGERLVSRICFTATATPVAGDFRVGGRPALPVTVLLEDVLRMAEWLTSREPFELTDIEVDPAGLCLVDGSLHLERRAIGVGGDAVEITVCRPGLTEEIVATMTVRCRDLPPPPSVPDRVSLAEPAVIPPSDLHWTGAIIPVAQWYRHACGSVTASVGQCEPADLWAQEPVPAHLLPVAALENILRMAFAGHDGRPLRIGRIVVHPGPPQPDLVVGEAAGQDWYAVDNRSSRVAALLQAPDRITDR